MSNHYYHKVSDILNIEFSSPPSCNHMILLRKDCVNGHIIYYLLISVDVSSKHSSGSTGDQYLIAEFITVVFRSFESVGANDPLDHIYCNPF